MRLVKFFPYIYAQWVIFLGVSTKNSETDKINLLFHHFDAFFYSPTKFCLSTVMA